MNVSRQNTVDLSKVSAGQAGNLSKPKPFRQAFVPSSSALNSLPKGSGRRAHGITQGEPKRTLRVLQRETKRLDATHKGNLDPVTGRDEGRRSDLAAQRDKAGFAREIEKASVLHSFTATEESNPANIRVLVLLALIDIALIAYFILTDNYLASLVFFVAGGLIALTVFNKKQRTVTCKIRTHGVQVNKDLYPYENLRSFWIFYDPPYHQELSIRSRKSLVNYIKIPLGEEDPVKIRKLLLQFLPEKKEEEALSDVLGRVIGL